MSVANCALVFVKPHASGSEECVDFVRRTLWQSTNSVNIDSEGRLDSISEKTVDQHYYSIASRAVLQEPKDLLGVPNVMFNEKFTPKNWQTEIEGNRVLNATQALTHFNLDAAGLDAAWRRCQDKDRVCKLQGGFYCGLVDDIEDKQTRFVINGFYGRMKAA